MTRQHRNQIAYPALWAALDGAIRDAMNNHPDIQIPDRRTASIVKRCVGQVLALQGVGAGQPAEMADGAGSIPSANGAEYQGVEGLVKLLGQPQRRGRRQRAKGMFPWAGLNIDGRRKLHAFIAAERSSFVAFHRGQNGLVFVELRRK